VSERQDRGARYLQYIWLVYLAALFVQPVLDPTAGPLDWIAVAVLIAAFLPLYRTALNTRDQRRTAVLLAALAILALVGSLVNTGAGVFLIYAAAVAGRLEPVRRAVWVIAALSGATCIVYLTSTVPMPWRVALVAPGFVFTLVVGAASIFDNEQGRAEGRLRRADEEIERLATIAERERIARDLHDLLGHTLSVIVLKSEVAARLITIDPGRAEREVRDIESTARTALTDVRAAVAGYRAKGIGGELTNARRILAAAGVDAELHADLPELTPGQESALALAVRESVTNVLRHAKAERVTIHLHSTTDDVVLEVIDDGQGSDAPDGAGLAGMRERVCAMGGQVTRMAAPGDDVTSGTLVRVTLPRAAGSFRQGETRAIRR
jgi:two-component system sensor histidine kinase DesK